jgi:hypothetical protein
MAERPAGATVDFAWPAVLVAAVLAGIGERPWTAGAAVVVGVVAVGAEVFVVVE